MADDIEDLKNKAAPVSLRIALATEELIEHTITTNVRLLRICDLKESQQSSDNRKHWFNTVLSLIGIGIALTAIYVVDGVALIRALF